MIFTGLPGSGKTTCGALLGETLGLPFFDTDELIESSECRTIKDIFATEGEAHFRLLERETLRLLELEIARAVQYGSAGVFGQNVHASDKVSTEVSNQDSTNDCSNQLEPVSAQLAARIAAEISNAFQAKGMVMAVGGGVPEPEVNREALKRLGTVVYLAAEPLEIAARLPDDGLRPLLAAKSSEAKGGGHDRSNLVSKLKGLLDRRRQAYECADTKIDTTGLSPHQIITALQEKLKTQLMI